jgi:Flp pilus assembly protein TadG
VIEVIRDTQRRGGSRDEAGLTSLELVLIAPALFVLLFLGAQLALWYLAGSVATSAAHDGANAGAFAAAGPGAAYSRANAIVTGPGGGLLGTPSVTVTADGRTVTVRVDGSAPSIVPGLDLPVHAKAVTPIEAFQPQKAKP